MSFGTVKRDSETLSKTVTLEAGDAGPITPKITGTGSDTVKAELREIEPHQKYELKVTVGPPWPNDRMRGSIMLDTGIEKAPQEQVFYQAMVLPRLSAVPSQLRINRETEEDVEMVVQLHWSDEKPPGRLLGVQSTAPGLDPRIEERNGTPVVVVDIPKGYTSPRSRGYKLTVRTGDPTVPNLEIPIMVTDARRARADRDPVAQPVQSPRARPNQMGEAGSINPGGAAPQRVTPERRTLERPGMAQPTPRGNVPPPNQAAEKPKKPASETPQPTNK